MSRNSFCSACSPSGFSSFSSFFPSASSRSQFGRLPLRAPCRHAGRRARFAPHGCYTATDIHCIVETVSAVPLRTCCRLQPKRQPAPGMRLLSSVSLYKGLSMGLPGVATAFCCWCAKIGMRLSRCGHRKPRPLGIFPNLCSCVEAGISPA